MSMLTNNEGPQDSALTPGTALLVAPVDPVVLAPEPAAWRTGPAWSETAHRHSVHCYWDVTSCGWRCVPGD